MNVIGAVRRWVSRTPRERPEPVLGLALGGGFARAIAHIGVLGVLERSQIPVRMVSGVSAGAIIAAAYASGRTPEEIARVACSLKFTDVAQWKLSRLGLADTARMAPFLLRLLKVYRFENMRLPLAVVATDLGTGRPVIFREKGDVSLPIRASCCYPGLFEPVRFRGRYLADGAISMEIPAHALRQMGATHVVSVTLPMTSAEFDPRDLFEVVNRSFQILQGRTQVQWRRYSSLIIEPDVKGMRWDSFPHAGELIQAGERAAMAALPRIRSWFEETGGAPVPAEAPLAAMY